MKITEILSQEKPVLSFEVFPPKKESAYETVEQACSALVRTVDTVEPDASLTALYEERYRQFRQIYPVCRALFPKLL